MIAKSDNRKRSWIVSFMVIWNLLAASHSLAEPFDRNNLVAAFQQCHAGYSTDELLIRDDLRDCFLAALQKASGTPIDSDVQRSALLGLLKLRKSGKLKVRSTKRGKPVKASVHPVAEIAARVVTDRHRITLDTLLADPGFRKELQQEAELVSPGIDPCSIRKSVLTLRKKRALRPELVLQVAQWNREVRTLSLADLRKQLANDQIPKQPGIYLFRNDAGYLYIGEATNLASRLNEHAAGSDRRSLAEYLAGDHADRVTVEMHIFDRDSPAAKLIVRRAYESELIRSRNPKFNVRP